MWYSWNIKKNMPNEREAQKLSYDVYFYIFCERQTFLLRVVIFRQNLQEYDDISDMTKKYKKIENDKF